LRIEAEDFLDKGDIHKAEPLIRQYLEFKIIEIIRKVKIPVSIDFSIRDDKKMINNGLDAIKAAINLNKSANSIILENDQIKNIDKILVSTIISNWVNHYATASSSSLSPYVLKSVLDSVDQFSDCFKYDCSCSGKVRRRFYKNLSNKDCSC
jgi:hypothetical protein